MWNQIHYHTYFAWFLLLFLNVAFKNIWNCMCNMAIPKGCLGSVPVSPATSTRMLQESLPLVSCLSVSGVRTSGPSSLSLWSRLWTAPCSHPPQSTWPWASSSATFSASQTSYLPLPTNTKWNKAELWRNGTCHVRVSSASSLKCSWPAASSWTGSRPELCPPPGSLSIIKVQHPLWLLLLLCQRARCLRNPGSSWPSKYLCGCMAWTGVPVPWFHNHS